MNKDLENLYKKIETLTNEKQKFNSKIKQLNNENENAIDEITLKEQKIGTLETSLKKSITNIHQLNEKVSQLKKNLENINVQNKTINENLNIETKNNQIKQQQMKTISERNHKLTNINHQITETIKLKEHELNNTKEQIKELRAYIDTLKTKHNTPKTNVIDHNYHKQEEAKRYEESVLGIVTIPSDQIGRIIGKEGNKIKNIQNITETIITTNRNDRKNNSQDVKIEGKEPKVQEAIKMIKKTIICRNKERNCKFEHSCRYEHEDIQTTILHHKNNNTSNNNNNKITENNNTNNNIDFELGNKNTQHSQQQIYYNHHNFLQNNPILHVHNRNPIVNNIPIPMTKPYRPTYYQQPQLQAPPNQNNHNGTRTTQHTNTNISLNNLNEQKIRSMTETIIRQIMCEIKM